MPTSKPGQGPGQGPGPAPSVKAFQNKVQLQHMKQEATEPYHKNKINKSGPGGGNPTHHSPEDMEKKLRGAQESRIHRRQRRYVGRFAIWAGAWHWTLVARVASTGLRTMFSLAFVRS